MAIITFDDQQHLDFDKIASVQGGMFTADGNPLLAIALSDGKLYIVLDTKFNRDLLPQGSLPPPPTTPPKTAGFKR